VSSGAGGDEGGGDEIRAQVRGSVLLVGGRIFAAVLNMVIQVLTVRALTQSGYAAFAYALVVASVGEVLSITGMHRSIGILLPRHEHARDARAALSTLAAAAVSALVVGLAFVLVVVSFQGVIAGSLASDRTALTVLVVLAVLGPVMGAETLFDATYAALGRPRAIFLRQYVMVPCLRLAAVLAVLAGPSSPVLLAWGYLIGGVAGLVVAAQGLRRILRDHALYRGVRLGLRGLPVRTTMLLTLPLFANNLVELALESLDVLMLAQLADPRQVALLRAVAPVAAANEFVVTGFTVMFTPIAARMQAERRHAEMNDLYWQTALWRAVLAFPVLMLCTVLAEPVTLLLFGERYAASAPLLAALGAGVYLGALAGPNQAVMEITGRFRQLISINVATVVLLFVLNVLLIPRLGGLGAAISTSTALVFRGLTSQVFVLLNRTVTLPGRAFVRPYLALFGALAATGIAMVLRPDGLPALLVAVALSLAVLLPARRELDVVGSFPMLGKVPGVTLLFGRPRR
jgi:O-antigen/teichoic acid export membrane protein